MTDFELDDLIEQLLETWRRHAEILLDLLDAVPRGGMKAVPTDSRGRTVGAQFAHIDRVRQGWLQLHATGVRPKLDRVDTDKPPTKAQIRKVLKASIKEVDQYLAKALRGDAKTRMFGQNPVRWLGYLIAHESHHRGQIMLALKQCDMRLPEEIAVQAMWGKWMRSD